MNLSDRHPVTAFPFGANPSIISRMRHAILLLMRSYPWRHQVFCLAPLCALLCILPLSMGTAGEITVYFSHLRPQLPLITTVLEFFTHYLIVALYAVYLLVFLVALVRHDTKTVRWTIVFTAVHVCMTVFLVQFCKTAIGRPRPEAALAGTGYLPWTFDNENHSMPSGHAAESTSAASALAVRIKADLYSLGLGFLVAIVGFSRLYLSRHHMSDIVAGACVGLCSSLLIYYFCNRETL